LPMNKLEIKEVVIADEGVVGMDESELWWIKEGMLATIIFY